jgi:RHS repeat-associated protein
MKPILLRFAIYLAAVSMASSGVWAQLAPTGSHYAGRASDTGHTGDSFGTTGAYPASIPLDLPPERAGLPVPLQIVYTGLATGAAGLGWDIPLSYVKREKTFAKRRPAFGQFVLPEPREQMQLSLPGQTVHLVREGPLWVARNGTLALVAHETSYGWVVHDGEGRTYTFVRPSNMGAVGLWLLKSVATSGGASVELTHEISTWPVNGGSGFQINLTRLRYNTTPAQHPFAGCAKHEVELTYGEGATEPLSLSMLPDSTDPLVRFRTLTFVDVKSRPTCTATFQRLRGYELQYRPDADTASFPDGAKVLRLHTVRMLGRQGTNVALPVASYEYGTATHDGKLEYAVSQTIALPADDPAAGLAISGAALDTSVVAPPSDARYATWHSLIDVTGDGRPDLVFKKNDRLWVALNHPASTGETTLGIPLLGPQGIIPFQDAVFQAGAFSTHTASKRRLWYGTSGRNTVDVWRQAIDVNGDGRIDIVDAGEEPQRWIVYLNTPGGSTGIQWRRRVLSVERLGLQLVSNGHVLPGGYVPLSRRSTGVTVSATMCLKFEGTQWMPIDGEVHKDVINENGQPQEVVFDCQDGITGTPPAPPQVCLEGHPSLCLPTIEDEPERTFTEWELSDLNGDGYPDFVFNSSAVDFRPEPPVPPVQNHVYVGPAQNRFGPARTNLVQAAFNVVGVRFQAVEEHPFSNSVSLNAPGPEHGVEMWEGVHDGSRRNVQRQVAGLADVNGDGLVDRVVGRDAFLGTYLDPARAFSAVHLTLPGELSRQESEQEQECTAGTRYTSSLTQGLRDLTGDGIPDYFDKGRVWIGTGTRFAPSIPIISGPGFVFSHQTEACDGSFSNNDGGLFDVDGDGRPEVLGLVAVGNDNERAYLVQQLVGGSAPGIPEAGRLTAVDNGQGARTSIAYRSAKEDLRTPHQVPFPEIVVSSVETTGTHNLGGSLMGTRHAYGYAALVFDSALDAFTFAGYQRSVVFRPYGDQGGRLEGSATVIDAWPLTPLTPSQTKEERWLRTQRVGLVRDVYTVRGSSTADLSSLLGVDANHPFVIGVTHHEWQAKLYEAPTASSTIPRDCLDMVDPFDFDVSLATTGVFDACRAHGFGFEVSTESWYGPRAPPTPNNVQTRARALEVDDFGRVLFAQLDNDVLRSDDDVCVESTFAAPTGNFPRVLSALASRRISDCSRRIFYASESWTYDGLMTGAVSRGRTTSHTVQRIATDNGADLGTVRKFDATYDSAGNLASMTTHRDGATRTVRFEHDPFGLVVVRSSLEASGLPSTESSVQHDPVSLKRVRVTDAHGTQWGTEFDGFGRRTMSTVTPLGGSLGVTGTASYSGFSGTDPAGRRVMVKAFTDGVTLAEAATIAGRTSTMFLDELGRVRRTELELGADYGNEALVVGSRIYDGMGRVAFEADSHRRSESPASVYGSSYHYKNTGDLDCIIRGRGPQLLSKVTDVATERFPTCFERSFEGQVDTLDARDAASLQSGSPHEGVVHRVVSSAVGRVLERSTLKAATRIEHAAFTHDRLAQLTSITRFTNPVTATGPLHWTWRNDSLGQMLQMEEPEAALSYYAYSDWGEPVETRWKDGNVDRRLASTYDALSRLTSTVETADGVADPETLDEYAYDVGASTTPLMTPTFVLGRLARARSPSGQVALSYDAFGRVNGRAFTDSQSGLYVEKTQHHADGSLAALELYLPDRSHARERAQYVYDSAGRLRTATYADPAGNLELYRAQTIDAWGRVRKALFGGQTTYGADYADHGRRLAKEVTVESPLGSQRIELLKFDSLERELSRRELSNGAANGPRTDVSYDALGRLDRAVRTGPSGPLSDWTFAYDTLGNILHLSDAIGAGDAALSYGPGDRDRICRIAYGNNGLESSECNVEHDVRGNVVRQPTRTGSRQMTYFGSGYIRTVSEQGAQARFAYDAFGRVQELDVQGGAATQEKRRDRRYGEFIERRDATTGTSPASFITRYIPGDGGILASRRGAGDAWVFHFGELRGDRLFTDLTGALVQRVDYQPFGEATSSGAPVGSPSYTSYQWNGGDALGAFGLTHLGARIYDPVIGRFLARDPLLIPRTANTSNPYAFAMNDPWNLSDPKGTDPENSSAPPISLPGFGGGDAGGPRGGGSPHPKPPPPSSGPQTIGGMQLRNLSALFYGSELPPNFGFDTLASSGISLPGALHMVAQAQAQITDDADVDEYNDMLDGWASSAAGVGDALNWPCWLFCSGKDLRAGLGITSGDAKSFQYNFAFWGTTIGSFFLPKPTAPSVVTRSPNVINAIRRCCFAAGTLVATPEGLRPIETIAVGDLVVSRDPASGQTLSKSVTELVRRHGREIFEVAVITDSGAFRRIGRYQTTDDHPWRAASGKWLSTIQLRPGSLLQRENGKAARVVSVERTGRTASTYNLEVADFHTYFVGEQRLWVHNACNPWVLTAERASQVMTHRKWGRFYKSISDGLWWAKDAAGHGGSAFKVFTESSEGLNWYKDADQFGTFISGKYKGPEGVFIPWSALGGH